MPQLLLCCIRKNSLTVGKHFPAHSRLRGFSSDRVLENRLLSMYAKCGNLRDARKLFDEMPDPDECSWSVLIAGCAKQGLPNEALELFRQMQGMGVQANQFTLSGVLPACASLGSLHEGMEIHQEIVRSGLELDMFVSNALVDMYAKCGCVEVARHVFDKMSEPDRVSWTTMIAGYVQAGRLDDALSVFRQMPRRDVRAWTAMMVGYAQKGFVDEAMKLFDEMPQRDVASWNAMIAGLVQNGYGDKALKLYAEMQSAGLKPNSKTFASIIPACANPGALQQGKEIHKQVIRSRLESTVFVASSLVDMYAKCGDIQKARELFDKMQNKDVLSWTVMIAGYTQNGFDVEALEIFDQMQLAGVKPDFKTFTSVLPACANLAALQRGMVIHEQIVRSGVESESVVMNALIDMYAKCGSLYKARELFDRMHKPTVVSWTAMIAGYAMHGYCRDALKLFEEMKQSGTSPNHITLVCVLSACCHAGFLEDANRYFTSISECYHITPTMEHYSCMVDILGRAGKLDEAHNFIKKMAIKPNANVVDGVNLRS
ncbi:pentatricopeptide repeat-containing protein At5g16860 isoform X2 [Cryptomeria japonica]|uniref:pentatricopeptide repeat-containing protein At5g16860 isoform X2 n=1 Tax=Cryptomeria japonica TaxID=3369 RepID=UPI0027DA0161|nr:pentatricopeptide repeat-containing protein At5g16860 isoform X2 [Cryptomeria japonica]